MHSYVTRIIRRYSTNRKIVALARLDALYVSRVRDYYADPSPNLPRRFGNDAVLTTVLYGKAS